jgi:hypothetical protein
MDDDPVITMSVGTEYSVPSLPSIYQTRAAYGGHLAHPSRFVLCMNGGGSLVESNGWKEIRGKISGKKKGVQKKM